VNKYINNKLDKMVYKGAPLPTAAAVSQAHGARASWVSLECLAGVMHRVCSCGVQGMCGCTPSSGFASQFGVGGGRVVLGCIMVAPVRGCAAVVSWVCG
jgi:hypothetical protein